MNDSIEMRLYENNDREIVQDIKPVLQRVFTSEDGKALLRFLLFEWGYFSICNTPEMQAMRNYATTFLNKLGNLYNVEISADIVINSQ
jgi:hypothetical protein